MKILRVLRRRKIKLSFIFLLLLFFIVNTYAWMTIDKESELGTVTLDVNDWSVAFVINDEEIKTEEYTFEIEDFHPGITTPDGEASEKTIEKTIDVYNTGEMDSTLEFKITEIYLYGQPIYNSEVVEEGVTKLIPETIGAETDGENENEKTANIFGNADATIFDENNENYTILDKNNESQTFYLKYPTPFTISYTYDKKYLTGQNQIESATSWMKINLEWNNDEANNDEDTRLGNLAYDFKNAKDEERKFNK